MLAAEGFSCVLCGRQLASVDTSVITSDWLHPGVSFKLDGVSLSFNPQYSDNSNTRFNLFCFQIGGSGKRRVKNKGSTTHETF